DATLDKEALRVMSLLKTWEPGKQRGKLVKVQYTVPINFALDGDSKEKEKNEEHSKTGDNGKEVFRIVEDMPEFPGGDLELRKLIENKVNYPTEAKKAGIQGKVFVTFVVAKDGNTTDAKIARGVHPLLDKDALRVVNDFPAWKPGKQRGQAVNVEYTVPINFVLK
ncbi:MAG: TonB family protein, partial [Bacteroidetes bacterium]|nr:TonB family protein [Bacteroidota bacterium]